MLLRWAKVVKSTSKQTENQFNTKLKGDNPNIQKSNSSVKIYIRAKFRRVSDLYFEFS